MNEVAEIVKNLATSAAAIVAAVVAVLGLNAWRSQLRGKTEYDLARRFLRTVYRVRDAIQSVRAPVMLTGEVEAAVEEAGLSFDEVEPGARTVIAYERRWQRFREAWSDLELERLEAEVLWGIEALSGLQALRKCSSKLFAALHQHSRLQTRALPYGEKDLERQERIDETLYYTSDDPNVDTFTGALQAAVAELEVSIKPKLKLKL